MNSVTIKFHVSAIIDDEGDFPYPLGDFPLATHLDWALIGDLCKGINVT